MGDNVAIIGGSTVGRDHFPVAAADVAGIYDVGPRTNRELQISIEDYCRWFYLVRRWSVAVDFSIGSGAKVVAISFNAEPYTFSDQTYDPGTASLPSRESDLVLPRYGIDCSWYDNNGVGDFSGAGGLCEITDYSSDDSPFADEEHYFELSFSFGRPEWNEGLTCSVGFDNHIGTITEALAGGGNSNGTATTGTVVGALTIDGTYVLDIYDVATPLATDFFNITIDPLEYWPYATKAGLPVYDTSTGAQLNDPFS